ncbi:MAG: thioredoxin-dependent thiol peroxidase [Candidatus Thermoplasmatota archaeon]|nr:thioredoxin-dependent thiol peroxidase [Candidatus Thermoplasmatota archaeon]MEC7391208.1 thioredoxin-dependent thiol peroxidase [Candidatus Thermoplasmatota archaeon]
MSGPDIGDIAPNFTAKLQNDEDWTLSENLKKTGIILYFYPKDSTPGCTTQACDFRDAMPVLSSENWTVIGVSRDSASSHLRFIDKQNLNFDLIVDSDTEIHQLYGAWGEKKNYGKVYMGAIRSTFIIGQDGIIQWCGKGVKSKGHVERLLKILDIENQ